MTGSTTARTRVAVCGEDQYRRDERGLSSDQSFTLFVCRLAEFVDLVVVGRLDSTPGATHHRLPGGFEFVPIPDYPSLAHFPAVLRATVGSIPKLWRTAGSVDAVWVLGPTPLSLTFAMLAKLRRRRVVLGVRQNIVDLARSRHGRGIVLLAASLLERAWRLLARGSTVLAVGTDLGRQYGHAKRVIPLAVSLVEAGDLAGPAEIEARDYAGELTILSVGRLEPQKNPLLLADAIAELKARDPRWRLVVCGDGSMLEALEERVRELGVGDRVELRGYVPVDGGLGQLYRQSHAFLHVSWTEGFPQVLLEAFAAGLPTVATAVGGIEEWTSESALLIPPGNAAAAADALERLAREPELRTRLAHAGLEVARSHTAEAEAGRVAAALRGETDP
jgi:glycosyltransferase involved in cell wall biosynthesis